MKDNRAFYLIIATFTVMLFTTVSCEVDDCPKQNWYQDLDKDGFGNIDSPKQACTQPIGYVPDSSDFDDNNATSHPGAPEICNDGLDNDGDGFADCNDSDCVGNLACE